MIFDGGREDWESAERRDHRVGSVIAVVLAFLALCTLLGRGTFGAPMTAIITGDYVTFEVVEASPKLLTDIPVEWRDYILSCNWPEASQDGKYHKVRCKIIGRRDG